MKSAVLWNVTLCGLGNRYTHFGGTVSVEERYSLETQATCSCKTLVFMYKTTHCYILPVLHWLFGPCRPRASFRINFQMSLSLAIFLQPLTFFFVRHYSSSWTLASSKIVLHCTRSCVVVYIRFPILEAFQQIYVLWVEVVSLMPSPQPRKNRVSLFFLGHHLWPVWHGRPYQ